MVKESQVEALSLGRRLAGAFSRPYAVVVCLLLAALFWVEEAGAANVCPAGRGFYRDPEASKSVHIPCLEVVPTIDGLIDDPIWDVAAVITDFLQVDPEEGAEPSEKTEIRILYSSEAIYFAIRAYESDPRNIRAAVRERDGDLNPDDRVMIIIDSFNNRRDAFSFQINPLGSRRDVLFENNSNFYPEWDGIWYGDAHIDDQGWTAEIAIPTKTLAFEEGTTEWGLNISRRIRHRNEEVRWTSIRRDLNNVNVSQIGSMTGLEGLDQGMGLDIKVAGAAGYTHDRIAGQDSFEFDPSLDLFYRITPSLTGSLTFNTDFAEAAVDERRVNLTRFSLFFPETRDFFLQDVGIFEFADLEGSDVNGRPFFTRRIGLAGGEVVDILAGGKVTGRLGDTNLGLLSVQTDSSPELGVGSKNLSVGRVAVNVLDESSVGAIFTHGNPSGSVSNSVYGADFRYQNNNFMRDRVLTGNIWFQKSDTGGVSGGQTAWGASIRYPNDRLAWNVRFKDVGENFNPALGFVERAGIRDYRGFVRLRWRPSGLLRTVDWREFLGVVTDRDDNVETVLFNSKVRFETDSDDGAGLDIRTRHESLDVPFRLPKGITIPAGDYTFVRPRLEFYTSRSRMLSIKGEIECCDYYDGRNLTIRSFLDFRPSGLIFTRLRYEHTHIKVPGGDGIIRIGSVEFKLNITPEIQWANIVQYDNVSDNVGLNSRFRWIIEPGSELFLVVNQDMLAEGWDLRNQRTEAVIKLGHTFRL